MHASLKLGDAVLTGSDAPPGMYEVPQGFHVALNFDKPADAERVFQALADGATVRMPLRQTFWAARFGMHGRSDRLRPEVARCGVSAIHSKVRSHAAMQTFDAAVDRRRAHAGVSRFEGGSQHHGGGRDRHASRVGRGLVATTAAKVLKCPRFLYQVL
jgi:hypothetical protein